MALTQSCESECKESKNCRWYDHGTIGQGISVDISQMTLPSGIGIGQALRVSDNEEVCSLRISGFCC